MKRRFKLQISNNLFNKTLILLRKTVQFVEEFDNLKYVKTHTM